MGRISPVFCSLLVAQLIAVGCSRRHPVVESVVRTDDGTLWVAGSEGLAGYYVADRFVREDYPRPGPRSQYGHASYPAARVLHHDGTLFLFTRHGEAHRWEGGRWVSVLDQFPSRTGTRGQVDWVIETPDGRLLIQIHARLLAWASRQELATSRFELETTPTFFTSLAFVGGTLHGLGWADDGNTPAFRRRDGPGRWPVLATLPNQEVTGTLLGVVDLGQGTPAVVAGRGLFILAGDQVELVAVNAMLRQAGVPIDVQAQRETWIIEYVQVTGQSPLYRLHGADPGLLGRESGQSLFRACPTANNGLAGAFRIGSTLRVVTRDGSILDLEGERCRLVRPRVIER